MGKLSLLRPHHRRLRLEPLEDRRMLSVYTVDSLEDDATNFATPDGLLTLPTSAVAWFGLRVLPRRLTAPAAAERFADDVPDDTKRRRNAELLAVQAEVGLAHHKQYVGLAVDVLVTGPSPRADKLPQRPSPNSTQLAGRTRGNHIVVFDGPESLIGQYVDVTIEAATALTLSGRRCVS